MTEFVRLGRGDLPEPGEVYNVIVTYRLIDGTTTTVPRRIIVWEVRRPLEWLVDWASETDKPTNDPQLLDLDWAGVHDTVTMTVTVLGRTGRRYTANDPAANSVEIMTAAASKRLADRAKREGPGR